MSGLATNVQRMERPLQVLPGYRYEWALFTDWCVAAESVPLPASPETVAAFLDDNPAGDEALRRRVAAINRAHRDVGESERGTVTAIRLRLDRARSHRVARRRIAAASIVPALPTIGWPAGLFGRRDALVLVLYALGLGPREIASLDRRDIEACGDGLRIRGRHQLDTTELDEVESGVSARTWTLWQQVLDVADRSASTRVLEELLRTGHVSVTYVGAAAGRGPVVVPIDRWGAVPFPLTAMTAPSIADVIAAHLNGTAPRHPTRPERVRRGGNARAAPPGAGHYEAPTLDDGYYDAGTAARRDAAVAMTDVDDILDDIDIRTEQMMRRTMDLLETFQTS